MIQTFINNISSGLPVPRIANATAIVIWMDGQSNNVGQATINDLPARLDVPLNATNTGGGNVYIWYNGVWSILEAGVNQNGYGYQSAGDFNINYHGMEMELGYQLANQLNIDIYIIKTGRGGRPLSKIDGNEDFHPDSENELHQLFVDQTTNALAALDTAGVNYVKAGWFWSQGEWESRDGSTEYANVYNVSLKYKIKKVREFLKTKLPVFISRVRTGIIRNEVNIATVQSKQLIVANSVPFSYLLNTDSFSLKVDDLHYDSQGLIDMGNGHAQLFMSHYT